MAMNFDARLRRALKGTTNHKGAGCVDDTTLGRYIDGALSEAERTRVEEHAGQCFSCLDRLVELKELLYLEKKRTPVSPDTIKQIEALVSVKVAGESPLRGNGLLAGIGRFLLSPLRQWPYVAVGLVTACIAVVITLTIAGPEKGDGKLPQLNLDAFAQVRALDAGGKVLKASRGLVIGKDGLIASDLSAVAGASSVQITFRDGKSFTVKHLWKDDGRNLAFLKVEGESLSHFSIADLKRVSVGQKAFVIRQSVGEARGSAFPVKNALGEAVISDFKSYSVKRGAEDIRYIQLASFSAQYTRGAIVDGEGKLLGIIVTGEKHVNLAAPLEEAVRLVKDQDPIPVDALKGLIISPDALNFYFKGILARDARKPDEAIEYFKKAVVLNPNLEGAHLELGFLYYRKRLFDLERREYEEALKINPNNTDTLFYLATNLETRGLYEEAARVFEKVIELDPDDTDTYYELGLAYLARGEKGKAMNAYNQLQKLDPGLAGKLKRLMR